MTSHAASARVEICAAVAPDRSGDASALPWFQARTPFRAVAVLAAGFVALAPAVEWWMGRLLLYPDNRPGLMCVALAAAILAAKGARHGMSQPQLRAPAMLMLLAAIACAFPHPLISVCVAFAALALVAARCVRNVQAIGIVGLIVLSLPVMPPLQRLLGYPLRLVSAEIACGMMSALGHPLAREGVVLWSGDTMVSVEAPCSGLQMLWTALAAAAATAAIVNLSWVRSSLLAFVAVAVIVLLNGFRVAALAFAEISGLAQLPAVHVAIGCGCFAAGCIAILAFGNWIRSRAAAEIPLARQRSAAVPLFLAAGIAFFLSFRGSQSESARIAEAAHGFPGWPAEFEGTALVQEPLSKTERHYFRDFPGRVGRFTDGERTILLRWSRTCSYQFHLSGGCFQGAGYQIVRRPTQSDNHGQPWSRFEASRRGVAVAVREMIRDESGRAWPDENAWRWNALIGRSNGPWWGISVAEQSDNNS